MHHISSDTMETLCFRLPGHGDMTLNHINSLRSRHHFCDVTILTSNNQTFRGHKVVLAACSPFLRDQFLLNPSSKLQVSMLHSSSVMCDLLQSCYTGVLQFKPEDIVNYLTAASYLQMECIVERCRNALKKYMQLKSPNPLNITKEERVPQPVIVSGSIHSIASPSGGRPSPVHSPEIHLVEENSTQDSSQRNDSSLLVEKTCVQDNASDHGGDTFQVYISDEEQNTVKVEDSRAPADEHNGARSPAADGGVGEECGEYDLIPTAQVPGTDGFSREGLRSFRHRLSEPGWGRGRAMGRGFKRRRWVSSQEKKSPRSASQDLWYLAGTPGGFAMDFSEGFKPGSFFSVDLPRLDLSLDDAQGDKSLPPAARSLTHFAVDESGNSGEGSCGLNAGTSEAGDESVAVVGSTSSVTGPVICEHCGVTCPSTHALAMHYCSAHQVYSCPFCDKQFQHSYNLNRHMALHRGNGKPHQCPLCSKGFTQRSTLIDHMNLHSGERPHRCAYCHARFAHKPALRRHLKEQHGKTTVQNSIHEQEERERSLGRIPEETQQRPVTEQAS
ncbi:zinc finger and BTB domain-containing protein 26-like isoform X1 [Hippocampus zosterae]|uniref:zinc finger and BTB domain-containing protein 26-like isoform X1 n=2 Tax=Hippocampus zosterae TaxID=109293 RepID=UPI00223D0B32|nr:zinc finger and BTB domain-containing protein 26-like isoform X1 [Hippocampus zosterae]XP_051927511.1 zinc finger and BTB domain-containing protein 26-like isoform X1 [Hippocampus zosterae]